MTEIPNRMEIVPARQQTMAFVAILALFALTFALAHVDLGRLNTPVGLLIAGAKASLVMLYFMQLRRASGLHRLAAGVGVFWLGILLVLTLGDYVSRDWLPIPSPWP